jgi:hypothetical protein
VQIHKILVINHMRILHRSSQVYTAPLLLPRPPTQEGNGWVQDGLCVHMVPSPIARLRRACTNDIDQ